MIENRIHICGDQSIWMPELTECNECDIFEERLSAIEALLENMSRIVIAKTDSEDGTVTVTSVGTVEGG